VSEKNGEDQGEKLDQIPESDESILLDVDALLAEEDPEFLKSIGNIKIDASKVVSEDSVDASADIQRTINENALVYLKRPFEFKSNPKVVAGFWTIVIVALVALVFAWKNKDILFSQQLFITSLETLGSPVQSYNPNSETEDFYDNTRFAKNLISMSPLHVNIKPSENSTDNPMLAFEVTVEGLSADAIVEIKDRQAEFKDLLARLTETKTYDELVVADGKRQLCDQFRDLLNANLTRGQVRRVLLKTFIIKP
jgi:flagellar basal body-associated protein FliL